MSFYTKPYTELPLLKNVKPTELISSATPLSFLNNGQMPDDSLFDTILGNIGGTIGEVSVLLLLVGGIYLLIRKTIRWHIHVCYIGTVALLALLFPQVDITASFVAYEVFSGGLILGAFFMATDYVTAPVTNLGRIIYGVGCGIITVVIRYFGQYPEGVSFAIMIMNLLVWYLDMYTRPSKFGGVEKKS
jgi:electron transport complex protein RnfD